MPRRDPPWLLAASFLLAAGVIALAWLATPRAWVQWWLAPLRARSEWQAAPSTVLRLLPPPAVEAEPEPAGRRRRGPPASPPPATLPLSGEWWRSALRVDESARESIFAAAPADSLRELARRLLAALPESLLAQARPETSRAARLELLTRAFTVHLQRHLPAWQAAARARTVADIISREAYLFGEYWRER